MMMFSQILYVAFYTSLYAEVFVCMQSCRNETSFDTTL